MSYVDSSLFHSPLLVDSQTQSFQPQNSIEHDLMPTAMEVMKFCGHHVISKDNNKSFDWGKFTFAMKDHPPSGVYLEDSDEKTINQMEADVSSMVDKIVDYLHIKYNILPDVNQLRAEVLTTFTGLMEAGNRGWADFSWSSSSTNSSFEYRVIFFTPHPHSDGTFSTIVMTIILSANIVSESSWWGLESSTVKKFGAMITSMKIHVEKGFKDPGLIV